MRFETKCCIPYFYLLLALQCTKKSLECNLFADASHQESFNRTSEPSGEFASKIDENDNKKNLKKSDINQSDITDISKNKSDNENPKVESSQSVESYHEGSHLLH